MTPHNIVGQKEIGKNAPDFTMFYPDVSPHTLSEFKGKVVYISFWASWCKPCLTNFVKYEEIRKELANLGVIMLNVSIDADEEKWKASMLKENILGVHAIASKNELYPDYQLSSIPLYEIVGKDGKFIYLSDEAGRDIVSQFKGFLDKE